MDCSEVARMAWWNTLLGVVVGAALGYLGAELREFFRRKRERQGHFEALGVEIQICSDIARGDSGGKVRAPAYRMPLMAYQRSFPLLIADGVLSLEEINALARFYMNAAAFNYSLDQAQAVLMKKEEDRPPKRLENESFRARMKALKLNSEGESSNHYHTAIRVITAHLPEGSRKRLLLPGVELEEENEQWE